MSHLFLRFSISASHSGQFTCMLGRTGPTDTCGGRGRSDALHVDRVTLVV